MSNRQKRRNQPGRAGFRGTNASRVAHEDRTLERLLVKAMALPPGSTTALSDGRVAFTHEANAIYSAIRDICGRFAIGQHRMQAALVRLHRKGML